MSRKLLEERIGKSEECYYFLNLGMGESDSEGGADKSKSLFFIDLSSNFLR